MNRLREARNEEDVLAREARRQEKIEWEEKASAWRQSFNATRTKWLQQFEEQKASAQKELDRLREEQVRQRQKHEVERGTWERDLEKRKEAARLDTERRLRAYLTWRALTPHQECISYGTRMYEAELMNVPADADGLAWCRDTAIQIHSVNYQRPAYCSRATDAQKIMGYWKVVSNEPTCTTFWESFSDNGCLAPGSGQRRYEAQLGNHQWPWGNWKEMCSTTPATFNGMHFDSPHMCENRGKRGIYGIWLSRDEHC
ncbi:hypothetical protein BDZ89DRAFT_938764 [Hymenopellis radicata]|nr:hypothetical protein BDZ89DRAFT_938764 [Hymenopellis radicata]